MKYCLALLFAVLLAACAVPVKPAMVIDGSSAESTRASLMAMHAIRPESQMELATATLLIQLEDVNNAYEGMKVDVSDMAALGRKIDGLNREQILVRAARSKTKAAVPAPVPLPQPVTSRQ